MNRYRFSIISAISIISGLFLFLLSSCLFLIFSCQSSKVKPVEINHEVVRRFEVTLLAAGDNLFHETIIDTHRQRDGSYDFSPIYSEIKNLVQSADIAFVNQETVMGGTEFGYQGYPAFNTPQSLAKTLTDTGFTIINQANNHAMDMGAAALYNTLDLWDTFKEITVLGARRSGENAALITKNNITLGFLSYTYGLNGQPLPRDNPNAVSLINRQTMTQEINALRPLCDFLIVSMHWGEEYLLIEPDAYQKDLAKFLAEHNVDLIIGHHPHVLQKVETLPRPDGKQTLCFYSLGNFVSNQREKARVLGGIMLVTFTKETDGAEKWQLTISNSGLLPVVTHFEAGYVNTKVYPLYSYTENLLKKHLLHIRDREMDFGYFNDISYKLQTKLILHDPFFDGKW